MDLYPLCLVLYYISTKGLVRRYAKGQYKYKLRILCKNHFRRVLYIYGYSAGVGLQG